ncbi:aspartate aminotransferase family protein [Fodinicola acaciae]|uniref:aspartate aminotransferase family protein n=1 Tax=Fodinicola acaciae TaxID=2681555 RepID=UPI0013D78B86|nr:aspartate aminotransferase family protein [Fodinicola acaciae]
MRANASGAGEKPEGRRRHEAASRVIPGGVNSATRFVGEPYAFTEAAGAYVTDADGQRYLDYHAAFGAIMLGHNAPVVQDAVRAALDGADLMGLGVSDLEIRLAELVTEMIPSAEQMIAATSGSEAVSQAVRLCRTVTGRRFMLKFQGGFHGWQDAVARNVISTPERAYGPDPLSAGILPDALDATLIAEFNDLDSVAELFQRYPEQIAAVILEPIPHNIGACVPTQEFVQGLRKLTDENGALLVFDEVITGFRHAPGGYQEVCGIRPDLTTFGKAMANGYPIAGVAGPERLMRHFSSAGGDVLLAGTYNGHPVCAAAAIATMTYLRENPDFYQRTHQLGERVRTGLAGIAAELDIAVNVSGFGGVFAMYFLDGPVRGYRDLLANNHDAYVGFHRRMTESGFLMLPMSLKRNHISAVHTEADIDRTLEASRDVLKSLRADGIC